MDERFIGVALIYAPISIIPCYFFKHPYITYSWGLYGSLICLLLATFLSVTLSKESSFNDQLLVLRKRMRRTDSFLQVLLDPRANCSIWVIGGFVGFYVGCHLSLVWTVLMTKSLLVSIPIIVYAGTCAGAMVGLVVVQFCKFFQELMFTSELAALQPLPLPAIPLRLCAAVAAAEVAGMIGFSYIAIFVVMYYCAYSFLLAHPEIIETVLSFGWTGLVVVIGLVILSNTVAFLFLRVMRMRKKKQEEAEEAQTEMISDLP